MKHAYFEVDVSPGPTGASEVRARAPSGNATAAFRPPWDTGNESDARRTIRLAIRGSTVTADPGPASVDDAVERLGHRLTDSMLPAGPVRELLSTARAGAEGRNLDLVIRLRTESVDVAALPWEFLYDPQRPGFLGLHGVPVVREVAIERRPTGALSTLPVRLLAVIVPAEGTSVDATEIARRCARWGAPACGRRRRSRGPLDG